MRTQTKPTQFAKYEPAAGKVLTVVLNVNQSSAVHRNRDLKIAINSELRRIEAEIMDQAELQQFHRSADLAREFVKSYQPRAKSLVVFSQANGSVSSRELNVPVETEIRWQELPHIQPLVDAEDKLDELLIVLMDRRHSRFLTSLVGTLTEHPGVLNPYPTAHTQAPGNDHTKSQPAFHRKTDERERHYLKTVVERVEAIAAARSINRIVLAGSNGPCKELYFLLPKKTQKHIISFAVLPSQATHEEIALGVVNAQELAERDTEAAKVESLIERAGASDRAVIGVSETMKALTEGRVHELVYSQGISLKGARCNNCASIVVNQKPCPKCRASADPVEDAMDMIIGTALDTGATVGQVHHEAAEKLILAGGIGAFLRY